MAPDCLALFIDGVYRGLTQSGQAQMDELLSVDQVGAIEVFERGSIVPVEFQAPLTAKHGVLTTKAGCGAIAVWTKGRISY